MTIPAIPMQLLVETEKHRADLHISGNITKGFRFFGMTTKADTDVEYNDVVEALKDLPEDVSEITVHINSYGGEVAEGVAIYNALRSSKAEVTTVCEGFACSVASVIFMAGKRRVMRDSSLLMLHNASMPTNGDANAHRKAAEDLDVITELSKTAYLKHATESLTSEKLDEIMDAETWVTPEQALEWGLATEIDEGEGDTDEPTQSVRKLVVNQLTARPKVIAEVNFTQEQLDEIVSRVMEQITLQGTSSITNPVGITSLKGDEPYLNPAEPEPEPQPVSLRLARIFNELASPAVRS